MKKYIIGIIALVVLVSLPASATTITIDDGCSDNINLSDPFKCIDDPFPSTFWSPFSKSFMKPNFDSFFSSDPFKIDINCNGNNDKCFTDYYSSSSSFSTQSDNQMSYKLKASFNATDERMKHVNELKAATLPANATLNVTGPDEKNCVTVTLDATVAKKTGVITYSDDPAVNELIHKVFG